MGPSPLGTGAIMKLVMVGDRKKNMIQERICLSQARETSAPSDNTVNGIVKKIYNDCGPRAPAEMIPGTLTNKAIHTAFCRFPCQP